MDGVIEAHQVFLTTVITRCLLDADSRQLAGHLRSIFDLIICYTLLHHELSDAALTEAEARCRYQEEVGNIG
ncbi:unnamed protein product [Protopolystoma xenopodis]|uniref:Gamma tubulin complex component C-terminal domain-containing protein n=1 Tax=Protopolystoma xenopodis TaxID=117903 RepID=A0A3S4ZKI9_9PLAT|nr:unnamed protein product [Protopolystoma xenopodis]